MAIAILAIMVVEFCLLLSLFVFVLPLVHQLGKAVMAVDPSLGEKGAQDKYLYAILPAIFNMESRALQISAKPPQDEILRKIRFRGSVILALILTGAAVIAVLISLLPK